MKWTLIVLLALAIGIAYADEDVVTLNLGNFDEVLRTNDYVLVEFYVCSLAYTRAHTTRLLGAATASAWSPNTNQLPPS